MLQLADRRRVQQVIFAVDALVIVAADSQLSLKVDQRTERELMLQLRFRREHRQANAFQARGGSGEVGIYQVFVQADRFEDLRSLIALQGGNAHLRESL